MSSLDSDIEILAQARYRVLEIPEEQAGDVDRLLEDIELKAQQKQIGGKEEWRKRGEKLAEVKK